MMGRQCDGKMASLKHTVKCAAKLAFGGWSIAMPNPKYDEERTALLIDGDKISPIQWPFHPCG
jgi:hypothetical protein